MVRVIFLDIDGVLNNRKSLMTQSEKRTLWLMDPDCVARLDKIIDETGAMIVVSSSWRHGLSTSEIETVMVENGLRNTGRIIDATPRRLNDQDIIKQATGGIGQKFSMTIPRAWEILEWLKHNKVDSFVVIDDDSPYSPMSHSRPPKVLREIMRRFVQTDHELGLLDGEVEQAINHLRKPWLRKKRS